MTTISYRRGEYNCREDETLLDAFLRQGVEVDFSCRNGTCHVCKHKGISGLIPKAAQQGLNEEECKERYFLLCRCIPTQNMEVAPITDFERGSAKEIHTEAETPVLPDLEMWDALGNGGLLRKILEHFYTLVYQDERLAPFFEGVTKQRPIEKQYLFMRQLFSGEKVYFGDRPRNAHHWMVISNELFDYREALMESCLREAGLAEHLIKRWLAVEESFRSDMVKDKPQPRFMHGVEMPLDGFGEEVLTVGSICDGCEAEVRAGTRVSYHLRLGKVYCPECGTTESAG